MTQSSAINPQHLDATMASIGFALADDVERATIKRRWLTDKPSEAGALELEGLWWQRTKVQLDELRQSKAITPAQRVSMQRRLNDLIAGECTQPHKVDVWSTNNKLTESAYKNSFWQKINKFFTQLLPAPQYRGAFTFGLALLALGEFAYIQLLDTPETKPATQIILSGGGVNADTQNSDKGAVFKVRFNDTTTLKALHEQLDELDATIMSGPSALGFYEVVISDADHTTAQVLLTQSDIIAEAYLVE